MQTWLMDTGINRLLSSLCRMLVHSLWQSLLLVALTALVLVIMEKRNAAARYNLVVGLFSLFLLSCTGTFAWQWNHYDDAASATLFFNIRGITVAGTVADNWQYINQAINAGNDWLNRHAQEVVGVWTVLLVFKMVKMLTAVWYNHRIRFRQVTAPSAYWLNTLARLCAALKIDKTVVLLESGCMKMPVVVGHFKPVILVPLGLLMSLPADEAEAILLHELAHIRRNDYLVNFLQHIGVTIFFFNPAVHWVSGRLREEREACCDDMAVSQTQNKKALVAALISFKKLELFGDVYQTAFPGKKDQLLRRVNNILGNNNNRPPVAEKLFITGCLVLLAVILSVLLLQGNPIEKIEPVTNSTGNATSRQSFISAAKNPYLEVIKQVKPVIKRKRSNSSSGETLAKKERPATGRQNQSHHFHEKIVTTDIEQVTKDRMKAKLDQERALPDYQQALRDQQMAMRDQERAEYDQQQAKADQRRAVIDQQQAYNAQQQALKSKLDAEQARLKHSSIYQ